MTTTDYKTLLDNTIATHDYAGLSFTLGRALRDAINEQLLDDDDNALDMAIEAVAMRLNSDYDTIAQNVPASAIAEILDISDYQYIAEQLTGEEA